MNPNHVLPRLLRPGLVPVALAFLAAPFASAAEIHRAAASGNLAQVEALVTADAAAVSARDDAGCTPLWHAVRGRKPDVVRWLLTHGADAAAADNAGVPLLNLAVERGQIDVVTLLLDHRAPVKAPDADGTTPLHVAAQNGRVEIAALLLDRGADVNAPSRYRFTPLHYASWQAREPMIQLLLERDADAKLAGHGGTTVLHTLAAIGRASLVGAVLQRGADADAVQQDGQTVLFGAARGGHLETVRVLLAAVRQLDVAEPHFGHTALHAAAVRGHAGVVQLLRDAKADLTKRDTQGRTALDLARRYGHQDVVLALSGGAAKPAVPVAAPATSPAKATVWYTGTSGWAVRIGRRLLVFDYARGSAPLPVYASLRNGCITPAELREAEVTVFVSHEHGDHFDRAVLAWQALAPKVTYVFGFDPGRNYRGPTFTQVGPQQQVDVNGMKVAGIRSLDTGGGFLVQVDGLTLFHAGDHANLNAGTREAYDREIAYLATLTDHVDAAFLPVSGCPGSWQREHVVAGFFSAASQLKVATVFPMHGGEREWEYRDFAALAKTQAPGISVQCAEFPGDSFVLAAAPAVAAR